MIFPVYIIGVGFIVISGIMFYNNYGWRTKIMKDEYSICGMENLFPSLIAVVGVMFLTPYIPIELVV